MLPSTVSAVVQWRSSLKDVHKDKVKLVNPPFVGRGVCHGLFHVAVKALTHTIRALVVGRYPDSLGT